MHKLFFGSVGNAEKCMYTKIYSSLNTEITRVLIQKTDIFNTWNNKILAGP